MSEAHDYTSRQLEKLERELRREYREAELTMRNKLKAFMQKFEKQNAVQLKALAENEITADSYKRWLNNQLSREKWFSGMVDMYTAEQLHVNQRAAEMINKALPAVYAEAHNVGTYQVEKGLSINTKYSLYNREAVGRLWKDKPQLLPKAKVNIPKDRMWNERQIRSAFTQGILQGESIPKLQKRLQGAGMITYKIEDIKDRHLKTTEQISRELARKNNVAAIRNARTMMTGAQNAGKLDSYRRAVAMGAKMLKMWSATMDDRTRDSHAFLDGVTAKLEEEFSNGLMYPADPSGSAEEVWNCRCELSMQLEGFERDRASLFDANEEHFGFDSYDEWKAAHGQWEKVNGKWQRVNKAANNTPFTLPATTSSAYKYLRGALDKRGVEYNAVTAHKQQPSEDEIISRLGGGDKTKGSCASVGLAYCGNKSGLDVIDFRGGDSQAFFSTRYNLDRLTQAQRLNPIFETAKGTVTAGNKLLKHVKEGNEYYFVAGRHAAIVRREKGILQYLELQSRHDNGWHDFDGNPRYTLSWRFGCRQSQGFEVSAFMINVKDFDKSDEFKDLLGFINTAVDKQMKGAGGHAK